MMEGEIKMKRSEIVAAARKWKGTPWQHQACLENVACDCIGLVRGTGKEFGLEVDSSDLDYSRVPYHKEERLYEKMKKYFDEIPTADIKPGDILLFGTANLPAYHAGILSYDDFIVHTWLDVGKVVESRLDVSWKAQLKYAFRFRGVTD